MRKILMIGVILLAICVSLSAVSADDSWSFNWSSSDSSNSDGGEMNFENGKLTLQGIEFNIPDGYKENESVRVLAEPAQNMNGAKYSACSFVKDGKEIVINVFFPDEGTNFDSLEPQNDTQVEKTISGFKGIYMEDQYGDGTPTFEFLKDGKIAKVNAPDDKTLQSVIAG